MSKYKFTTSRFSNHSLISVTHLNKKEGHGCKNQISPLLELYSDKHNSKLIFFYQIFSSQTKEADCSFNYKIIKISNITCQQVV